MGGTERGAGTARKEVKRECRVPGELGQFEGENVQFSLLEGTFLPVMFLKLDWQVKLSFCKLRILARVVARRPLRD